MKKVIAAVMSMVLVLGLAACGTKPTDASAGNSNSNSAIEANSENSEPKQNLEVEKELFDVRITLPADIVGEITQEQLDEESDNFHSATLNEDGSVTFVMSKKQHKELIQELADEINKVLAEMPGSEEYPDITKVEANDDFTVFTVTTKSTEISFSESIAALGFYMYGGIYGTFNDADPDNFDVRVDFINADSGEIIDSTSLSDSLNAATN